MEYSRLFHNLVRLWSWHLNLRYEVTNIINVLRGLMTSEYSEKEFLGKSHENVWYLGAIWWGVWTWYLRIFLEKVVIIHLVLTLIPSEASENIFLQETNRKDVCLDNLNYI